MESDLYGDSIPIPRRRENKTKGTDDDFSFSLLLFCGENKQWTLALCVHYEVTLY